MTAVPCLCGIDPGLKGGLAFYFSSYDKISCEDLPVANGSVDAATLAARIRQLAPTVAVVEAQSARPGQGVSSCFQIGRGFGTIIGVVAALGVPLHVVSPAAWKKHFHLDKDKEKSRALALRLWPGQADMFKLKKHEARAEAALIARFYAERILK